MKKYFAMAAVATMFAACTNEDVTPQVDALTGMPIVVKTNIATPVDGRAVAGVDNETDITQFLLNIEGDTDYFVSMEKNTTVSWKSYAIGEDKTKTECNMVWANGNQVTVWALYGGDVDSPTKYRTGTVPVSVYADQSEARKFKLSDRLYMPSTPVTPTTDGIEVNFQHLLSKVTITITGESEATDVKVDGTGNLAQFSPSQGTWDYSSISTYIKTFTACKDTYSEGTSVYEVILVPQEVAAGTFAVSFKMGDVAYKWTSAEAVTLESGKHYNIALTVAEDEGGEGGETTGPAGQAILMKSITVAEWTPATGILGGEVIEIVQ